MLIKIKPVRKQTFLGRFIDMPYNITYIWEYIGNNMKINEACNRSGELGKIFHIE